MECGKDSWEGYKMEDIREEMNIVFIPSSDKRMLDAKHVGDVLRFGSNE